VIEVITAGNEKVTSPLAAVEISLILPLVPNVNCSANAPASPAVMPEIMPAVGALTPEVTNVIEDTLLGTRILAISSTPKKKPPYYYSREELAPRQEEF
jgi:hypothetical protein